MARRGASDSQPHPDRSALTQRVTAAAQTLMLVLAYFASLDMLSIVVAEIACTRATAPRRRLRS